PYPSWLDTILHRPSFDRRSSFGTIANKQRRRLRSLNPPAGGTGDPFIGANPCGAPATAAHDAAACWTKPPGGHRPDRCDRSGRSGRPGWSGLARLVWVGPAGLAAAAAERATAWRTVGCFLSPEPGS